MPSSLEQALLSCGVVVALGGCPTVLPGEDVLRVQGAVVGADGVVDVEFEDARSRGEWWPCDARLTAQACVEADGRSYHVAVLLGLPGHAEIGDLGGQACVEDGVANGVFEILRALSADHHDAVVGTDLSAFVLVASDVDGDQSADVSVGEETLGVVRLTAGTLRTGPVVDFDAPFVMHLDGESEQGAVVVDYRGPMTVPSLVPGLEPATTCVASPEGNAQRRRRRRLRVLTAPATRRAD